MDNVHNGDEGHNPRKVIINHVGKQCFNPHDVIKVCKWVTLLAAVSTLWQVFYLYSYLSKCHIIIPASSIIIISFPIHTHQMETLHYTTIQFRDAVVPREPKPAGLVSQVRREWWVTCDEHDVNDFLVHIYRYKCITSHLKVLFQTPMGKFKV